MATLFLLLIYLAFISLGLPDSLLGAAWPVMRADLGAGLDMAGVVSFVVAGGTILSSLLSERLIRRFGTGRVTAVSVLATAAALLWASFAGSVPLLVAAAVPLGLGAGAVDAALNNYVALHYSPRHMNWLHAFWGVGAFVGPLVMGGVLAAGGPWRGGYRIIAGVQFLVAALLLASLPLWKRLNGGVQFGGGAVAQQKEQNEKMAAPAGALLHRPGVLAALGTFLCYCAAEMSMGLWGSSFLAEQRGFTPAAAAGAVSLYYLGITVGRFLSGVLAARFSTGLLIRTGVLLILAGAVVLMLPLPQGVGLVALAVIGLGCAPVYPGMIHETPHRFGAENSQRIIGWQMASAYCGSTFVPPLVGVAGRAAGMWVLPVFVAACALGMLLLTRRVSGPQQEG